VLIKSVNFLGSLVKVPKLYDGVKTARYKPLATRQHSCDLIVVGVKVLNDRAGKQWK